MIESSFSPKHQERIPSVGSNGRHRFAFVSVMTGYPWGGSEVLWSEAAHRLLTAGHQVFVSVFNWPTTPTKVEQLREAGGCIHRRLRSPRRILLKAHRMAARLARHRVWPLGFRKLAAYRPDLVCISSGGVACGLPWMLACAEAQIPYIHISQANGEAIWPAATRLPALLRGHTHARSTCFVSRRNLELFEAQVGEPLANAQVVWNPVQVPVRINLPWPDESPALRLACVGRLHPPSKGQDLILQVLSSDPWKSRPVSVSFFGAGEYRESLENYAHTLNIADKVSFRGHAGSVTDIWRNHHALLLPSRYEGLPLAVIEAMLCGRVPIVTDVGGNSEVIDDGVNGFIAAAPTFPLVRETLERAWSRRHEWKALGATAQAHARQIVPSDAAADFAELLISQAGIVACAEAPFATRPIPTAAVL